MKTSFHRFLRRLTLGLSFFSLCVDMIYAQSPGAALPQIMTPEAASLGKYGSFPIGYYTGSANINVPLYSLKENSFVLDIALQYDHSGFIPNKEAGVVGLNWSLIAGGIITRAVNGIPDDRFSPATPTLLNGHIGYIYGMLNANLGTFTKEYVRKLDFLHFNSQQVPSMDIPYEYYPDVFSFNFNGHQGRFVLGNDKKVKTISDKNYKVDFTNLSGQDDLCDCKFSEIKITTDQGDVYSFGGDINAVEITYPYNNPTAPENTPTDRGINCKSGVINAWHIKKVKLINGNEIIFNYEPQDRNVFLFADDIHGISNSVDYAYEKIYLNDRFGVEASSEGPMVTNTIGKTARSLIKTCYLSSIVSTNGKIEFFYSVKPKDFYGTNTVMKNPNRPKQLDRIKVTNSGQNFIKEIFCHYTYYGNSLTGFRQFLSRVEFKDNVGGIVNFYELSYYKTDNLPTPLTRGIDIWGYYNGKNTNLSLIPTISSGAPNYNIDLSNRAVDQSFCDVGLLSKIKYPTGGWSEFLYEGHDYGRVLRRKIQSTIPPVWFNENGSMGGARIKQINHSTGESQKYYYKKNYTPNATGLASSGILMDHNVFYIEAEFYYNSYWGNVKNTVISDNNIGVGSTYSECPIGYSEVTEVNSLGYTKYFYSTHETKPDVYTLGVDSYKFTPTPDISLNNFRFQIQRLMKNSSCDIERGKLLKTEIRNSDNQLIKEFINEYNNDPNRYNESVIGFTAIAPFSDAYFSIYHSVAFYCFQNNITKQTVTDFTNGNSISKITEYNYISNANPLLRKESHTNSNGQNISSEYKYPMDLQSGSTPFNVYDEMINRNMLSAVVESVQKSNSISNPELLRKKSNYRIWETNNLVNPQLIEKSIMGKPFEVELKIGNYDNYGNVLQAVGREGIKTSYEWGYQNTYPVVEIKNAENSLATTTTTGTTIGTLNLPGNLATASFTSTAAGNIVLAALAEPGSTYSISYSLTGPSNKSGYLCVSRSSTSCSYPETVTLTGMPAGVYNLTITYYSGNSPYKGASYIYPVSQTTTTGIKEFFFEGFEENSSSSVITNPGTAHSGRKYWNGSYTVPFTKPNSRTYIIQWWKLTGGKWQMNQQTFTNNMVLTGTVDDIRVFPSDAMMTTYTYDPLIGMTSQTDPSGKMITYEYDGFGRLKMVLDQDKNVLKTMDYQYQAPNNQ